ncbi:MAG TPA: GAF and ANTAR domain-containing protein [Streptosporangiaceae bacterium]|nr:GAF and ANTAR domain-containing protein [Streptosporangiaceae bacterium]
MLIEDLARDAADLLSVGNSGQMRSLNRLAEMAVREVPGCCGAAAMLWRDDELVGLAATHPDLAELADFQLRTGQGPTMQALRDGEPAGVADTLRDTRWPGYADEALCRGVRSSLALRHEFPPMTVVLIVASVRPNAIDTQQIPLAATLAAFGGAMLANASAYGDAQREAVQMRNAVESRSVVDQAKGILMHAHGCSAAEALERMRRVSQTRHVKVTDVAKQIVEAHAASSRR